jgi:hypothetical protein
MTHILACATFAFLLVIVGEAHAQYRPPPPAPRLPPLTSSNTRNIYAPWIQSNAAHRNAAGSSSLGSNSLRPHAIAPARLRAMPLPLDTLQSGLPNPVMPPSLFSTPYGPNLSRPSGAPVLPFGSSRYYYHR